MKIIKFEKVVQSSSTELWVEALSRLYSQFQDYGKKVLKGFDAEDIHQARVNSRKLLTLLRILDREDQSGLYAVLKEAQKRLGKVRDADVLIESFRDKYESTRQEGKRREATLLKSVIRIQKKKRKRSRVRLAEHLPRLILSSLDSKWQAFIDSKLEAQLAKTDVNQSMRELEVAYEQQKQAYRQMSKELGAEASETLDALHDLRIAAKELRYTASAAAFALDQKFHSHEKLYKEVQEQLGTVNDRRVWLETVEAIGRKKLDVGKKTWRSFMDRLQSELQEELLLSKAAQYE